jgi:hypothetical protein
MPDRKPEPWESGAAGPFLWIEGSPVEVWALGEERFAVRTSEACEPHLRSASSLHACQCPCLLGVPARPRLCLPCAT